jgi:hypothetical protein
MAKDPVCGMTVAEKRAAGTATHGGQDLLFLRGCLQGQVREGPETIRGGARGKVTGQVPALLSPETANARHAS